MTLNEIVEKFEKYPSFLTNGAGLLSRNFKCSRDDIYNAKKLYRAKQKEIEEDALPKIKKSLTRTRDLNRVINKELRENYRVINALEALNEAVVDKFNEVNFKPSIPENIFHIGGVLLVQLSDLHLNELVDLPNNVYDFEIASKRLAKYAQKVKEICKIKKVKKIVVAMTGDMINSDRRLDEITSAATNRTKASLIAVTLLQNFINDLLSKAPIEVAYVTGNESRVKEEWGLSDFVMTDNYDTAIFNMLRLLFKDNIHVKFIESNPVETVLNINNKHILMMHGTTVKKTTQASMQQIIGKYSAKGITIDYVIFGHIHFAEVTDLYGRSGSLVGNNVYSDYGINLVTKASQNTYFISEEGDIDSFRFELDKTEGIKGYDIEDDINAYNAKSATKLYKTTDIIKIVI